MEQGLSHGVGWGRDTQRAEGRSVLTGVGRGCLELLSKGLKGLEQMVP